MVDWDVVIIGGGPAGLSAAIYLARENLKTLILEKQLSGGLMAQTAKVDNYPGVAVGTSGFEIAQTMEQQAKKCGAQIQFDDVKNLVQLDKKWQIETSTEKILAKTVVIASGTKYRHLGVKGEEEFLGRSIHFCATCDGAFYQNKTIAVIGGGNSAIEELPFLAKFARKIYLLVRSEIRATDSLWQDVQPLIKSGQVEMIKPASVQEITSENNQMTGLKYLHSQDVKELLIDGIFVFIGLIPQIDFIDNLNINRDEQGFIQAKNNMTNYEGLFVCGDIKSGATRQIATAGADGVKTALEISRYLK